MCHAEMTTVTLSPMKDLEMKCPQKFTTANYVKGDAFQRLFVRRQSNCTAVPEIKEFVNFLPNLTQPQRLRGRFNHRCSCYRALGCGFFVPVFPFQRRSILTARDGFFSEANEASIKFSRKFQRSSHSGEKEPLLEFIAFSNYFHGRTMGPLALTSKEHYRTPFEPVIPGVNFLEYENVQVALDMIHSGKIVAVFVEPIQGESSIYSATKEFLQAL